jgi:hypothetical protein
MTKDKAQPAPVQEKWGASAVMNPDYVAAQKEKSQQALDVMAENARELGLDYEPVLKDNSNYRYDPPVAEPVARQYQGRDGVWKDFISEKHYKDTLEDGSWPIRNLYTTPPAAQRQWVGLTPHERMMCRSYDIDTAIDKTEAKLKEKNT